MRLWKFYSTPSGSNSILSTQVHVVKNVSTLEEALTIYRSAMPDTVLTSIYCETYNVIELEVKKENEITKTPANTAA